MTTRAPVSTSRIQSQLLLLLLMLFTCVLSISCRRPRPGPSRRPTARAERRLLLQGPPRWLQVRPHHPKQSLSKQTDT